MNKPQPDFVPIAWLHVLIVCNFDQSCKCNNGDMMRKVNHFCKDCLSAMCYYCANQHIMHSVLRICRYWYSDVVTIPRIEKHVNVTDIQTYNSNNEKVIHIKAKGSVSSDTGRKLKIPRGSIPCAVCSHIITIPYRFCSIACKLKQWHRDKEHQVVNNAVTWKFPSVKPVSSGPLKIIIKNPYSNKHGESSSAAFPSSGAGENTGSTQTMAHQPPLVERAPSGALKITIKNPYSKKHGESPSAALPSSKDGEKTASTQTMPSYFGPLRKSSNNGTDWCN